MPGNKNTLFTHEAAPWLYYRPDEIHQKFSNVPNGAPNVQRILDGKSNFFPMAGIDEGVPQPRVVVIADWTLKARITDTLQEDYATRKKATLQDVFDIQNELFDGGFKIYIWHKKTLVPLERTQTLLDFDIEYSSEKEILTALAYQDISEAQARIVNYNRWSDLVRLVIENDDRGFYLWPNQFDIKDLIDFCKDDNEIAKYCHLIRWDDFHSVCNILACKFETKSINVIKTILSICPNMMIGLSKSQIEEFENNNEFGSVLTSSILSNSFICDTDLWPVKAYVSIIKNNKNHSAYVRVGVHIPGRIFDVNNPAIQSLHHKFFQALNLMDNLREVELSGDVLGWMICLNKYVRNYPNLLSSVTMLKFTNTVQFKYNDEDEMGALEFLINMSSLSKLEFHCDKKLQINLPLDEKANKDKIKTLLKLRTLTIKKADMLGFSNVITLLDACPNLHSLKIEISRSISEEETKEIREYQRIKGFNFPYLKRLIMNEMNNELAAYLFLSTKALRSLKVFSPISFSILINPQNYSSDYVLPHEPVALSERLRSLKRLRLMTFTKEINTTLWNRFFQNAKDLRRLDIDNLNISHFDQRLLFLPKRLKDLNIANITCLDKHGKNNEKRVEASFSFINQILFSSKDLQTMYIRMCKELRSTALKMMGQARLMLPNLIQFNAAEIFMPVDAPNLEVAYVCGINDSHARHAKPGHYKKLKSFIFDINHLNYEGQYTLANVECFYDRRHVSYSSFAKVFEESVNILQLDCNLQRDNYDKCYEISGYILYGHIQGWFDRRIEHFNVDFVRDQIGHYLIFLSNTSANKGSFCNVFYDLNTNLEGSFNNIGMPGRDYLKNDLKNFISHMIVVDLLNKLGNTQYGFLIQNVGCLQIKDIYEKVKAIYNDDRLFDEYYNCIHRKYNAYLNGELFILEQAFAHVPQNDECDTDTTYNEENVLQYNKEYYLLNCSEGEIKTRTFHIREDIFDKVTVDESGSVKFEITEPDDLILCNDVEVLKEDKPKHYAKYINNDAYYIIFQYSITLEPNNPLSLKDFQFDNKMLCIYNNAGLRPKYSKKKAQYYLLNNESRNPLTITVKYLLRLPKEYKIAPDLRCEDNNLPDELKRINLIAQFYRNFPPPVHGEGALDLPPNPTDEKILFEICEQKKGACRHRARSMMYRFSQTYQITMPRNRFHRWIEIADNMSQRYVFDLGGYNARLNISSDKMLEDMANQIMYAEKRDRSLNVNPSRSLLKSRCHEFQPWRVLSTQNKNLDDFVEFCLTNPQKNSALQFANAQALFDFSTLLQARALNKRQPVYYIDSLEQLRCQGNHFVQSDSGCILKKVAGPAGSLYNFLESPSNNQSRLLIVNFSQFKDNEWVQANALGEKEDRRADGVSLPNDTLVIALTLHRQPTDSRSFQRRFGAPISVDFNNESLMHTAQSYLGNCNTIHFKDVSGKIDYLIDLYYSSNWEQRLRGGLQIQGNDYVFKPGKLIKSLETHRVELRNAPWHLKEFRHFWRQWQLHKRIERYGKIYCKPKNLEFVYTTGYAFDKLLDSAWQWSRYQSLEAVNATSHTFILNPSLFASSRSDYCYDDNTHSIHMTKGWLNRNQSRLTDFFHATPNLNLHLIVTRTLSMHQWAEVLSTAKKRNYQLTIQLSEDVKLPEELAANISVHDGVIAINTMASMFNLKKELSKSQVIQSSNIIETVKTIESSYKIHKKITVSGRSASELLYALNVKLKEESENLYFHQVVSELWEALVNGKNILLMGSVDAALADHLASLLLPTHYYFNQGKRHPFIGKLLVVTDNAKNLNYFPAIQHDESAKENTYKHEIQSITLPAFLTRSDDLVKLDLTEDTARKAAKRRDDLFWRTLKDKTYVYLEGKTGIGKTTFMRRLAKKYRVFHSIRDYIEATKKEKLNPKKCFIFADEANLNDNLERLADILDGHFWEEGKEYTNIPFFVFAGNPQEDGHGRKLPQWMSDNPNVLSFPSLIPAELYHNTIIPMLKSCLPNADYMAIATIFLRTYCYIERQMSEKVFITPRELEWMTTLFCTLVDELKVHEEDYESLAAYCANSIAEQVLSKDILQRFSKWFNKHYGDKNVSQFKITLPEEMQGFILQENHRSAYQHLTHLLQLSQFRSRHPEVNHLPGLNALIIEGDPGIGKSDFVKKFLKSRGFTEISIQSVFSEQHRHHNQYVYLPPETNIDVAKSILLKALENDVLVVIDEINSFILPEEFMNDLLMGIHPKTKEKVNISQFAVIGTQNSIAEKGRKTVSNAVQRRVIKVEIADYTQAQAMNVLCKKGVEPDFAQEIVQDYFTQCALAKQINKNPAAFSVLLEVAEQEARNNNLCSYSDRFPSNFHVHCCNA